MLFYIENNKINKPLAKTDIFGIKPYKNVRVKSLKPNWGHCFIVAVRTDADILTFSKMLYTEANYLFYIAKERFQIKTADFQAFIYNDILSENKVFYLQNTGFESDKTILGYQTNALFPLKRQKRKRKNQLSFLFEKENADLSEPNCNEMQNWHDFKADLAENSVDTMGKIDYLFPIQIATYEIIKPLLLHFPKMREMNYMLIEPERLSDAATFFMHVEQMSKGICCGNRVPLVLND